MEKRLLLAIVLSFVVIFAWQALMQKKLPPEPAPGLPTASRPQTETQAFSETQALPETQEVKPKAQEPTRPTAEDTVPTEREVSGVNRTSITVDTPLYRAVWSNVGAVLTSWRLKQHLDEEGEPLELVSVDASELGRYPFALLTDDPSFDGQINTSLFKPSLSTLELIEGESGDLIFEFADGRGTRVEKVFAFRGEGYDFDIQLRLWRNGQPMEPRMIWGPNFGNLRAAAQSRLGGSPGVSIYAGAKVYRQDERKFNPEANTYNFVNWASYDDQYFTALFITSPQATSAVFAREEINQVFYHYLSVNSVQKAYLGPKQYDLLSDLGYDAKKAVRFGFFGFIAEILYVAIKSVNTVIPNWGFCIIILTLVIKILFFPLTYSSTKSMARMQELQPKIKALRAKYKKAKQDIEQRRKLNEETMRLYKEHGVNPAGGCLPMLIQLPIFWGFFRLLGVAIEFRHSPFILWITDLSVKDPYYVIPILMGITQFISQKMTPTTGDATQQRMMLIMPVIMTIFFISFPSGLVLYWLTNNVLQIGQQYIMNRFKQKQKRDAHVKRRKK